MRRSTYGERDYAFGQLILALRSAIGLTQAGLSDQLGISKRAVGEWEAGSSYPKATHLKALIAYSYLKIPQGVRVQLVLFVPTCDPPRHAHTVYCRGSRRTKRMRPPP